MSNSKALQKLSDIVHEANERICFLQLDEFTRLDSICLYDNFVVYVYTVFEKKKKFKFKDLKKNIEVLKTDVVSKLMGKPSTLLFVSLCKQVDYSIVHLYIRNGHPRDCVGFSISPDELSKILQYWMNGD